MLRLHRGGLHGRDRKPKMGITSVAAKLKFLSWQQLYETEKPFQIFINIPTHVKDQRTTNLVYEDVEVQIEDVQSIQNAFLWTQRVSNISRTEQKCRMSANAR
jgi:hypothetical protein